MKLDDDHLRRALAPPSAEWRSEAGLRDAAVLVPLVERAGEDRLVFNLRRDDLPWHAGQVCFPGGARDGEETAAECAVRETGEEMGIAAGAVRLIARLPDRVSIAGFRVAVFAGRHDPAARWHAHAAEVAEVFEVPCALLAESARWSFRPATHPLARMARIPYFDAGSHVVWGLTGIILRDFVRLVLGFDPADAGGQLRDDSKSSASPP